MTAVLHKLLPSPPSKIPNLLTVTESEKPWFNSENSIQQREHRYRLVTTRFQTFKDELCHYGSQYTGFLIKLLIWKKRFPTYCKQDQKDYWKNWLQKPCEENVHELLQS